MSQPLPPSGGASFSVDFDRAPQTIRNLEEARDQMKSLLKDARALGSVHPPAADPVSRDAAQVLSAAAVGGPGSLVTALEQGIERMSEMAESIRRDLEAYRATESIGTRSFGGSSHA